MFASRSNRVLLALAFVLSLAVPLQAQTSNCTSNTLQSGNSTTLAFPSAVTATSTLVAGGFNYNVSAAPASPAITSSNNGTWTVNRYSHALTDTNIESWLATKENAAGGADTVTWNPAGASADMGGWFICEVKGASTPTSVDVVPAANIQSTTTPSIASGTLAQASEAIFALMSSDFANTQTITGDGTYTQRVVQQDNATSQAGQAQSKDVASTSSDTADWSFTGSAAGTASILLSVKFTGGAPPACTPTLLLLGVGRCG